MAPPGQQQSTEPYVLNLGDQRGFVRGLTYLTTPTGSSDPPQQQCHLFTGIPYALPPLGPFRWQPPRPLPPCYRYGTRSQPGGFDGGGCGLCPQPGYLEPTDPTAWDEDCLQLNIWVPPGAPPPAGWPVLFYLHGGWLQFGSPNAHALQDLLGPRAAGGAAFPCIVVQPAYRLGVLGFLAPPASGGTPNCGFWDQRLALVWTRNNISYWGGDAGNVTVGGLSAGAHSAFHQLAHDLYAAEGQRCIRRAFMVSNGCGVQPKAPAEVAGQFERLCANVGVPVGLAAGEKLERLRRVGARELVAASAQEVMPGEHEFRAVSDGGFVRRELFADIDSGDFARRMKERGVELLMGEVCDERHVYASWRAPTQDDYEGLKQRLGADYPPAVVDSAMKVWTPDGKLPTRWGDTCKDWKLDAYGRVYADLQVYGMARGFAAALERGGAGSLLRRWRIEWRSQNCDAAFPKEWGVTHGTDVISVWFWGKGVGEGLREDEKDKVRPWVEALAKYVKGEEDIGWGCVGARQVRKLTSEGQTIIEDDTELQKGLELWEAVRAAQRDSSRDLAKL